jgi:hypothetical protein
MHRSKPSRALAAALILACLPAAAPLPAHKRPAYPPHAPLPEAQLLPNAAAGLAKRYSGTTVDVTTYHYDQYRTGWNQNETDLTPATVASSKFGLLTSLNVDGNVFAQPLLVNNLTLPDGTTHDVLIIATGHNSVYAFDAQSYAVLWQVSLGPSQASGDVGCSDVLPEYGISGTPVIVRNGNHAILYVVAATEPKSMVFESWLHALDVASGRHAVQPVKIAPAAKLAGGGKITFNQQDQWNRAGLAYANASVYIGVTSHCDHGAGSITGWLLRYRPDLKKQVQFHTIETAAEEELASIWMTGFAPAIDPSGNVFLVTGNGNYDIAQNAGDYGQSVLKLKPTLGQVADSFTPAAYASLNAGDYDFGSGGVMLLPAVTGQIAPPMAVAIGKDAVLYLLNQNALGGEQANDAGALQATRLASTGNGLWGGPAYYDGPGGPVVYVQINGDVLRAFSVATGAKPSLTQVAAGTSDAGLGGSLPIVSSNGAKASTGVVWLIRRGSSVQLEAYNATSLGAPIFAAGAGTWSNPSDENSYLTPMEASGRVYVPAYKTVDVFGLTP